MERWLRSFVFVAMGLFLAVGCSSESPVQPELDLLDRPIFNNVEMDCQLSVDECRIIKDGIDAMIAHANPMCQLLGGLAQDRFDALAGTAGFRGESQVGILNMGVNTTPRDNYTNVYPLFWTNPYIGQPQATGALIIHEEQHHQGFGETEALSAQTACLNPQG